MDAATVKRQDLPPIGGYKPINYKRVPAKTYFSGRAMMAGYLVMTAGAGVIFYFNAKKIHYEEVEMRSAELALYPMLLAERDREYLKQMRRNRDEEAKLMANVEGWTVGTFYGEPIYKTLPKDKLIEPGFMEYYVHADWDQTKKRAYLSRMS